MFSHIECLRWTWAPVGLSKRVVGFSSVNTISFRWEQLPKVFGHAKHVFIGALSSVRMPRTMHFNIYISTLLIYIYISVCACLCACVCACVCVCAPLLLAQEMSKRQGTSSKASAGARRSCACWERHQTCIAMTRKCRIWRT